MSYSQDDLDKIKSAIASGRLTVRSGDDMVTYQSISEMIKVKDMIEAELSAASGSKKLYPRYQVASFSDE